MADSIQNDSKYRVAFDLALRIAHDGGSATKRDAAHWLKLYEACISVVTHGAADEAIKKLPKA